MLASELKVLVTGAAGSGGSYMLEHLVQSEPKNIYFGLARNANSLKCNNLKSILGKIKVEYCDLENYQQTAALIGAILPDKIYHFASNANVQQSFKEPVDILRNNIMGTSHLLEACRLFAPHCRILMCSTSEVYGQVNIDETPIKETNALRPASPYAVSKTTQDLLSSVYWQAYQLPIVRTRMFTYINPRRSNLFATSFAMQVARIELGMQDELLHGNLDSVRTHMDIRDVVRAYSEVMEKGHPGEVYNLGGTGVFKVGELLELLKQKAGCKIKSRLDSSLLRLVDVTLQIPDVSKFEKLTSWKPKFTLEDSVEHLLAECRSKALAEKRGF